MIFLEVKTRTGLEYGDPLEAINRLKIPRIRKSAKFFMADKRLMSLNPHFNVVSIVIDGRVINKLSKEGALFRDASLAMMLEGNKNIKIEHVENAF